MAHRKRFICIVAALFLLQVTGRAQNKSTFVHTIKQGETVYSIARTYRVSPESIIKLNPTASTGIRAGEILSIPQQPDNTQATLYHTIQAGETLYKLTKAYQTGADEICKANPGLTAENFKTGMVIRIPKSSVRTDSVPAQAAIRPQGLANSDCREMHKVKRKETLYSIARDFNITEAELKAANPEMNQPDYKLRKGDFICIPFPKTQSSKEKTPSNEELMAPPQASIPQKLIRMGVILPFKGGSPENDKMIEFYRGVLMAVEEFKKKGISVDIFAYDSGKNTGDIKAVINAHPLSDLDFIIGPLYLEQITPLSNFCQEHQIKLVVPFSSQGEKVYDNPYYYAINPPKTYMVSAAAQLTMEMFGKDNIIFLNGSEKDKDATAFTETIRKQMDQNGKTVAMLQLNDEETKWLMAMNQYKENVIIPNSSSIRLLNQLFPKLKEFAKKNPEYKIKLVGYPEWQTYANSHLTNFYQFNTYAYSSFFRNPLNGNADNFEKAYQKAFHTPTIMSWPCFGMLGFDTASFFLQGISTYGKDFDRNLPQIVTMPYQHHFNFRRISNWSGLINNEVEFIHYSPSHSIELIRLKK